MNKITELFDNLIFILGFILIFLFPIFFLPITSELSEYNKLILLIVITSLMAILWGVKAIMQKKMVVAKTPFDLTFVLILISFILSTWFSVSRYTSLFGQFNSWHFVIVEFLALMVLFYSMVTNSATVEKIEMLTKTFVFSSGVVAVISLLGYLNVFDKLFKGSLLEVLTVSDFTPAGNKFSLLVLLISALLIGIYYLRRAMATKNSANTAIFGATSLLILLVSVLWGMSFFNTTNGNFFQLGLTESWNVASSAIGRFPLFGTGPGTYSKAFTAYPPQGINQKDYWNITFTRAGNEYMTILTTMGIIGLGVWLTFVGKFFYQAFRKITGKDNGSNNELGGLRLWLILPIALILLSYLFFSSTVLSTGILFLLMTFWMMIEKLDNASGVENVVLSFATIKERFGLNAEAQEISNDKSNQLMQYVVGVPMIIVSVFAIYYAARDYKSNVYYTKSVVAFNLNHPAREVYEAQTKAINYNPYRDVYHRAYADTNISLARVVAREYGESITESQRSDVVKLVQESIRQVRIITEVLDPANVQNWQARAAVYQSLIGVATGADRWALQAYQNALNLSPADPRLRVAIGGLYQTVASQPAPKDNTTGDAPGNDVPSFEENKNANLAAAERLFIEAIRLKPDYANAYYNLANLYKEAKRYDLAANALTESLKYLNSESEDYKKVQSELEEVKKLVPQNTQGSNNSIQPEIEK